MMSPMSGRYSGNSDMLDSHACEEIILLISDINMPRMSGLDLLPIVKTRRPDLSVFMISAFGDAETVNTAQKGGAEEFLTKPVDFDRLRRDIVAVKAKVMRRDP
jgi:YesN/AraC family two-component response regulator